MTPETINFLVSGPDDLQVLVNLQAPATDDSFPDNLPVRDKPPTVTVSGHLA